MVCFGTVDATVCPGLKGGRFAVKSFNDSNYECNGEIA
jgi:hypothetical protein